MNSEASQRVLLKDRAYEQLKQLILSEHYLEGDFLSERSLAEKLGMSKTPVRSAVERLEAEGFLMVSPQQGIVVRPFTLAETNQAFDMRIAAESFAVRRLAGKLSEPQKEGLQASIKEQETYIEEVDIEAVIRTGTYFHLLICSFLGNTELMRITERQHERLRRSKRRLYQGDYRKRVEQNCLEHKKLLDIMSSGDGERAARFLEKHIEFSKRLLLLGQ